MQDENTKIVTLLSHNGQAVRRVSTQINEN